MVCVKEEGEAVERDACWARHAALQTVDQMVAGLVSPPAADSAVLLEASWDALMDVFARAAATVRLKEALEADSTDG